MDESKLPPKNETPERNLFAELHNWTDVFPWLRLVKVCRIAGGPVWIVHCMLVMFVWQIGLAALGGRLYQWDLTNSRLEFTGEFPDSQMALAGAVLWTMVWVLPHLMALSRVGALLTAGREIPSYLGTWRLVRQRMGAGLLIVLIPLGCTLPFVFAIWASAKVVQFSGDWAPQVDLGSMAIVVPCALIAGLLSVGGKVAVPLGLAGLMTEANPDPMDSISRGYEYTLRRLCQLVGNTLVAIVIAVPVLAAWTLIIYAGWMWAGIAGYRSYNLIHFLVCTAMAVTTMLAFAMIGGVYLLLRESASGQEVADVWAEPEGWLAPKMPSVQATSDSDTRGLRS